MADPIDRYRYEEIGAVSRQVAQTALLHNDSDQLPLIVLAVALHESDAEWAARFCMELTDHLIPSVRGNAVLGLGHIARIHGTLPAPGAATLLARALSDPDEYVRGQAESAVDDVEHFLGTQIRRGSNPSTANLSLL